MRLINNRQAARHRLAAAPRPLGVCAKLGSLIGLFLLLTTAAGAQEVPAYSAPPGAVMAAPALDLMRAPPDENAVQRGRGAMLLTLGSIALPISAAMLGASAIFWSGYSTDCTFSCDKFTANLAGGLVLDLVGAAVFAGAASMLAIGAQKYVEHKKPRLTWNGNGFAF
jgi:hypothetical protein